MEYPFYAEQKYVYRTGRVEARILTAAEAEHLGYEDAQLRTVTEQKEALQVEIQAAQEEERQRASQSSRLEDLRTFLDNTPAHLTEYEDTIVRKIIERITVVDAETIRIRFKTADLEIEKKLV